MDRLAGSQPDDQARLDKLPFQLIRTYGVGVDSKGKIYAADQARGRGVRLRSGEQGPRRDDRATAGRRTLAMIAGVALDDDDRLFVADAKLRHVLVFNPKHEQDSGLSDGDVLVRPGGVAIDRENRFVYVADTGNDVVDVFDADNYKLLRQIGKAQPEARPDRPGTLSASRGRGRGQGRQRLRDRHL